MSHEQFDTALDAAAKELLTDAPEELLKGVMYRIEKDTKPNRRFAFGRFTGFAAVAAAFLIFISLYQGRDNNGSDMVTSMGISAPAPGSAVSANEESELMSSANFDAVYDTQFAEADDVMSGGLSNDAEINSGSYSVAAGWVQPLELSELEQILYDYLNSLDDEITWINILNYTDDELFAVARLSENAYEITVTRESVSFSVIQVPQATEQAP
jgi:hypothetical protein